MRPVPREVVPVSSTVLLRALAGWGPDQRPDLLGELRSRIAAAIGVRHVLLAGSAREGIRWLIEEAVRRHGPGEAILWNYNFFAVPDMVRRAGLEPVFVDSANTFGEPDLDAVRASVTSRTRVLLVSHHFGRPSDVDVCRGLASELGLAIVEDCAHGFGARFGGRSVGTFGLGGAFSLSLTKTLTGVAGGVVVTDDDDVAGALRERERSLSAPPPTDVRRAVLSALAGTVLLGPLSYPALIHAPNRVADWFDFDPIDAAMTEVPRASPASDASTSLPARALASEFAYVALSHLETVADEVARRRDVAARIIGDRTWHRIEMPPLEGDRHATFLNFVVRVDDVQGFRRHLLRHGFDSRRDYIRPMVDDPDRYPRSCGLTRRGVYLPIRALRDDGATDALVRALERYETTV